jgi:hypothetical protein
MTEDYSQFFLYVVLRLGDAGDVLDSVDWPDASLGGQSDRGRPGRVIEAKIE